MKYKELKRAIGDWGEKYNYKPIVKGDSEHINMMLENEYEYSRIFYIDKSKRFVLDLNWKRFKDLSDDARRDLFEIVTEFAATKPADRENEKRFIIPLPKLITSDNKQQYLTHKDCKFFASRRDETLRQTWKEEGLKHIPEIYRQFAVEFDEDKEY